MGEIAALATSFCWSFTSIQFTLAGQRIGSVVVNRARLVLAVLYLSLAHLLLQGELWPIHAEPFRWGWLGLSGTIGLVLGDSCLFQAFLLIGTRRAMLLMTLVPVISTLVAWGWLGETLHPVEMGAVLLTVSGIAWVVSERQPAQGASVESKGQYALGLLLGLGGALGQALGLVTAKQGLVGDFPSLSATLIRMVVAMAVIWLLTLARGRIGATWPPAMNRRAFHRRLVLHDGRSTHPGGHRLHPDGVEPDHPDPPGSLDFPRTDQPALCGWYRRCPRGRDRHFYDIVGTARLGAERHAMRIRGDGWGCR